MALFRCGYNEKKEARTEELLDKNKEILTAKEFPSTYEGCPVTVIGCNTFNGCTKLKRIELPEGVKRLELVAFEDCVSLECVELPDTLEILEAGVFAGCENLKKIHLPKNISEIGEGCFDGCDALEKIHVTIGSKTEESIKKYIDEGNKCKVAYWI